MLKLPIAQKIIDSTLGLKKIRFIQLSKSEFEHVLSNYKNDDFNLIRLNQTSFKLTASESIGTANVNEISADDISLKCDFEFKQEGTIELRFSYRGSSKHALLTLVFLVIIPFVLATDTWAGVLLFALTIIIFFWFRGLYHHQQKNMIKYFLLDIKKYKYFKVKGYDYFSKKN